MKGTAFGFFMEEPIPAQKIDPPAEEEKSDENPMLCPLMAVEEPVFQAYISKQE